MAEPCTRRSGFDLTLRLVQIVPLAMLVGSSLGLLFGLIETFGVRFMLENIKANPETFAKQFARPVASIAWTALAAAVASVAVWVTRLIHRRRGATDRES